MMSHATPARLLRWALAAVTLLLLLALSIQCMQVYLDGVSTENLTDTGVRIHDIYTRDIAAGKLAQLLPGFAVWLVLVVAAAALNKPIKARLQIEPENTLRLLLPRVEVTPEMLAVRRQRRTVCIVLTAALAVCAAVMAAYLLNRVNFTSWDLEMVMGQMIACTIVPAAIALALCIGGQVYFGRSFAKELALAKKAPKKEPAAKPAAQPAATATNAARIVIFSVAVILVIAGIMNGGMYDVLVKAINICTECIGLG